MTRFAASKTMVAVAVVAAILGPIAPARADNPVYPTAVLPFSQRGKDGGELGSQVAELLLANLAAQPKLLLLDRQQLQASLREQELSLSGMVKPEEAIKVGRLTGAKIIIINR